MKTVATRLIVILMVALFGSGLCWAGNGNGVMDGDGTPIHDFDKAIEITYTGTVVGYIINEGLLLKVEEQDELILIQGIGPQWYWDCLGDPRPVKDDFIIVKCYIFEFDDANIADEITGTFTTEDGVVVEYFVDLRDDNGDAAWWLLNPDCEAPES